MNQKFKILTIVLAFVFLTTTFFGCAPQTNAQYEGTTSQIMQNEYVDQEKEQQKEQETTPQKTKMTYEQVREWLVNLAKSGTYDEENDKYSKIMKSYETSIENSYNFLMIDYYPDTDDLKLENYYVSMQFILTYDLWIQSYETTEMMADYKIVSAAYSEFARVQTTKDTYRAGVNMPCVSYYYSGADGTFLTQSLSDERDASNTLSKKIPNMMRDFDEFLKTQNAPFDLTDLGYKSFYGI